MSGGSRESRGIDVCAGRVEDPQIPVLGPYVIDLRVRHEGSGPRPAGQLGLFLGGSHDPGRRPSECDRVVAGLRPSGPAPGKND